MDNQENSDYRFNPRRSRVVSGIVLILIGVVFFARKLGVYFPDWLFTWPVLLIVIGLYVGAKHNFRNPGAFILMAIGSVFLAEQFYPDIQIHEFFWPVFLIVIGILVVIKPHHHKGAFRKNYSDYRYGMPDNCGEEQEITDQRIEVTAILGGTKRNVVCKDFRGGEITCVMGGAEINMSQADIQDRAVLEVTQVMGGAKLIIPANWEVQSEMMVILGGLEDKRPIMNEYKTENRKVLVIKGACIFGGLDIKSY